jgi:hypothetical protein
VTGEGQSTPEYECELGHRPLGGSACVGSGPVPSPASQTNRLEPESRETRMALAALALANPALRGVGRCWASKALRPPRGLVRHQMPGAGLIVGLQLQEWQE